MNKDSKLIFEKYTRVIGQSQAQSQPGIGTIVSGNPFNTKLIRGYEGNEETDGQEYKDFHAWQKAVATKFPNIQIAWEKNFCRALVDSVPVGFFDQNTKTGMIAKS
jgi:hypothetical protein